MSEGGERVAATCPGCSPDVPTGHEVLSQGGHATVRCTDCGHVHKTRIGAPATVERRVVVSQEGESLETVVDVPAEEPLAVGEEFAVETDDAVMTVRITSLQVGDEQRTDSAPAGSVRTVWTRAVGNVAVDLTLHPRSGDGTATRSRKLRLPGDAELVVGQTHEHGDLSFRAERILVREDAVGYDADKLDRPGESAVAKDVKRLYARAGGGSGTDR